MYVPKGTIKKKFSIGSDNDLAPIWRQAIIWTNDGLHIYASPGLNELKGISDLIT